jgi:hypothetical protein
VANDLQRPIDVGLGVERQGGCGERGGDDGGAQCAALCQGVGRENGDWNGVDVDGS